MSIAPNRRVFSTASITHSPGDTVYVQKVEELLRSSTLQPVDVRVIDTSGGCGASFAIAVKSFVFRGSPKLKQHRMVQDVLKEEIAKWHAVTIDTKTLD